MKKTWFLSTILVLVALSAVSQMIPKKCYMHLSGLLDRKTPVYVDLVKAGDTLYGTYTVETGDNEGKLEYVYGKITTGAGFWLKEEFEEKQNCFEGQFADDLSLRGTFIWKKDGRKSSFVLLERYPEGSVMMNVWYMKESLPLVKKPRSPKASLQLGLLLPGESANPVLSDSLKKSIINWYVERTPGNSNPDSILAGIRKQFFGNYLSDNMELYKQMPDAGMLNWELWKTLGIAMNEKGVLTMKKDNWAYTGGAHGLFTRDFRVYDLKTGQELSMTDIFTEGSDSILTGLLTRALKEMSGIRSSESLSAHGFFVDEVKPGTNFYVIPTGIGFYYNHYEIAPYSNGPSDIFLPFGAIRDLLKKGTVVDKIAP